MRVLFAFIFRLVLLALFTFGFVVLFEHGPERFRDGARTEWNALVVFAGSVLSRLTSAPAPAAPPPAATATASPAPKQPPSSAGTGTNKPATATPAPTR